MRFKFYFCACHSRLFSSLYIKYFRTSTGSSSAMSLKDQLKNLATPVSSAFSVDSFRRRSLVYENPKSISAHECFHDCKLLLIINCFVSGLKAFKKLCEVDSELNIFNETLFSPGSLNIQMSNLQPFHKRNIDNKVSLFLFLMNIHLRTPEALWVLEWLVYK